MEVVFGASVPSIRGHNSPQLSNGEDRGPDSNIPPTYDTHLFPGGIPASTQPTHTLVGSGLLVHPLIRSLTLPPATSISSVVSTFSSQRDGGISAQGRNNNIRRLAGSFTVDASGTIVRDHNRIEAHDGVNIHPIRANPSMLTGSWADDGISLDDFSSSFGQALNNFLQDQTTQEIRNNERQVDEVTSQAAEMELPVAAGTCNQPTRAPEAQSETAEVSCAMATSLTISQPAHDSSSHSTNPIVQINNPNHPDDSSDAADDPITERCTVREDDATACAATTDSHEINQEDDSHEERNFSRTLQENLLTCPPDIDPDVFRSLPVEMQQEIIEQHAQISESGLDPEALAALPEDLRREVIEEEQHQRQATQSLANPANVEEMDNARWVRTNECVNCSSFCCFE